MPEGAVYVGRPSKWGNPFRVVSAGNRFWTVVDDNDVDYREPHTGWADKSYAVLKSVRLFYMDVKGKLAPYPPLSDLRGKDLVCWCPLDEPCHADVLLELANGGAA
jgi:hypothetical protein